MVRNISDRLLGEHFLSTVVVSRMSDQPSAPEASEEQVPTPPAPQESPVMETPVEPTPVDITTVIEPAAETAPVAETVVIDIPDVPQQTEEEKAEIARKKEEDRKRKEEERARRDVAFAELEGFKEKNTTFDVLLQERVKGGLRGDYNGLRIFLPASHFGIRKNVPEDELNAIIGNTVQVRVHELQSDDAGYKSAVVSRRDVLTDELWTTLEPGTVLDGTVSSVTTFGAFVNVGGVEGLVHVSRLSRTRVEKPSDVVKKGDKLKVTITEVDSEKKKLSLSHKEHEADPWIGVAETYPAGMRLKGTVRRITDFGAYVQIAPRIEGLLRISELSWTQRVKHPSDVIAIGQEVELEVLSTSEEKHQLALGLKQTLENPWLALPASMPVGSETTGIVQQVSTQGAVIRVNDVFDGFMPRSKMLVGGRGAEKADINPGDSLSCVVIDMNPAEASLILAQKGEDGNIGGQQQQQRDQRPQGERRDNREQRNQHQSSHQVPAPTGVTIGDLLKDAQKSILQK